MSRARNRLVSRTKNGTKSGSRVKAYRHGIMAETLAASLFRLKGYRIVERRYRSPVGEIDLVAIRSKRLVFVGVKRRETKDEAAFAVTAKQKAAHRPRSATLARQSPGLYQPHNGLRRRARRALDLAAPCRERISCLT